MTVRSNADLRIITLAVLVVLPLLAAGCSSSPEPYFGWDTQSAKTHRVAVIKPKPRPTPSYNETRYTDDRTYDRSYYETPVPTARPAYSKYDRPADASDDSDYVRPRPTYDNAAIGNARFAWPVRGRVLSEFGSYPGGEKNNGINIAAAPREPIRAAADGSVSYAGNELRSYGNLVLIKHDGGYITAYAHADNFIVGKGQWVARGQVIGYVGTTGDVRTPQLHFEVRRGSHGETPIDPRQVLGSMQVANR
jgi:murein DD-endopeptidase MepM/ murein hydrolase activator NlpD